MFTSNILEIIRIKLYLGAQQGKANPSPAAGSRLTPPGGTSPGLTTRATVTCYPRPSWSLSFPCSRSPMRHATPDYTLPTRLANSGSYRAPARHREAYTTPTTTTGTSTQAHPVIMEKWIGHGRRRNLGRIPILRQTLIATGHISSLSATDFCARWVPPDTPPPTPVRPPGHRPRNHPRYAGWAAAPSHTLDV